MAITLKGPAFPPRLSNRQWGRGAAKDVENEKKLARLPHLAAALNYPLTPLSGLMRLVSQEAALGS